jgi:hypothetical protein
MQTFYSVFFPADYVPSYGFDPAAASVDFYTISDTIIAVNNSVQSVLELYEKFLINKVLFISTRVGGLLSVWVT